MADKTGKPGQSLLRDPAVLQKRFHAEISPACAGSPAPSGDCVHRDKRTKLLARAERGLRTHDGRRLAACQCEFGSFISGERLTRCRDLLFVRIQLGPFPDNARPSPILSLFTCRYRHRVGELAVFSETVEQFRHFGRNVLSRSGLYQIT